MPGSSCLFLVLFTDAGPLLSREQLAAQGHGTIAQDTSTIQLERELRDTRERLQGTIEEHETALEELRSANEELHTVNQELAAKVDELNPADSDLRNLFESTQVAIVFLDRQSCHPQLHARDRQGLQPDSL